MGTTIDNRVVEMQFNNGQFESNAQKSIETVEKLKKSLDFKGATDGLDQVAKSAKNVSFDGLASGIEGIANRFSNLGIVGMTILQNITNSAFNAGKQIAASLTIDPIRQGFAEYELQLNSIQTILAGTTGESLQSVTAYLDELNDYADKTIYSFADMTANIGKFTNAGIELGPAVKAIQGISNVAAVSGSNAQQASHAMYNFAQAISSGYVKLIDWKSIENAQMATKEFKDQLIQTALEMGTVTKTSDGMYATLEGNSFSAVNKFNDSLKDQWMTTDVLVTTLAKYSDETTDIGKKAFAAASEVKTFTQLMSTLKEAAGSGWAKTWSIVIGDFDEAKEMFTGLSNTFGGMIQKMADARNNILEGALGKASAIADEDFHRVYEAVQTMRGSYATLKDWVPIERSHIATEEFRTQLLEAGVAAGALKKTEDGLYDTGTRLVSANKNFADSLQDKWLSQDILISVLDEVAKKELEVANASDEAKSKMLRSTGRELLLNSFKNIGTALSKIFGSIRDAFRDIFPKKGSETLYKIIESFEKFTEKLIITDERAEKLRATFRGVFAVFDIIGQAIKFVVSVIVELIKFFVPAADGALDLSSNLGDLLTRLDESFRRINVFGKALDFLRECLHKVTEKVKAFFASFKKDDTAAVEKHISAFEVFSTILSGIWNVIKTIGSKIAEVAREIGKVFLYLFRSGDVKGALDLLNGGIFASLLLTIEKVIGGFSSFGQIGKKISGILGSVKDAIKAFTLDIKAGALIKIAIAIGILAAALLLISSIDPGRLVGSLGAMAGIIGEMVGTMVAMSKLADTGQGTGLLGKLFGGNKLSKIATAMIEMSAALLIISFAVKNLAGLDPERMAAGVAGIGALLLELTVAVDKMSSDEEMLKGALNLLALGDILQKMGDVCVKLAQLSWEEMARGLLGVGGLFLELGIFIKKVKDTDLSFKTALSLIALGASLLIMAQVCKMFANMSWEEMARGLVAVAGLLLEVTLAIKALPNTTGLKTLGLISLALALLLLVPVMKMLGAMSWESIAKGLVAIAGAITAITIAVRAMPKTSMLMGAAFIMMAEGLLILVPVMKILGNMTWESIAKGLLTVTGALTAMTIAVRAMPVATPIAAAGLIMMAEAMLIMVPVLAAFGQMSWESIAKGLVTLAGALTIFGVAGKLIGPAIWGNLLGLSAAIFVFGVGVMALGVGLFFLAGAITALAAAGSVGATAFVAAVSVIIMGLLELVPSIIAAFGDIIKAFCDLIIECTPKIAEAFKTLLLSLIKVIIECAPSIAEGVLSLIMETLKLLSEYAPKIVDYLLTFLIGVINKLAERIPELVSAISKLIGALISSISEAIKGVNSDDILKLIGAVGGIAVLMQMLSKMKLSLKQSALSIAKIGVVLGELTFILAGIGAISQIPGLQWLVDEGGKLLESVGSAIGKFIGGLVGGIASGLTSNLPEMADNLSSFMEKISPFIEGANSIQPGSMDGVKSLADAILVLTAASFLDGLSNIFSFFTGESSLDKFADSIVPFGEAIVSFSDTVSGKIDKDSVEAAAAAGKMLSEMAAALPNSGGLLGLLAGENDLDTFTEMIVPFGEAIAAFSEKVTGKIDKDSVAAATEAGKMISEMAKTLPNSGGVLGFFAGENDLDVFSEKIVAFGKAMAAFAEAMNGISISPDNVDKAISIGNALSALEQSLPENGGLFQKFTGEKNLAKFGTQISLYGQGIVAFADAVKGHDFSSVDSAAKVGSSLATMANSIPDSGGILQVFTGSKNLADFSYQIACFGSGIVQFANAVKGASFDADKVNSAVDAGTKLAALGKDVDPVGGLIDIFVGTNDLGTFGATLAGFGAGVAGFAKAVKNASFDDKNVASAVDAGTKLAALGKDVDPVGGLIDIFTGTNDLGTFGVTLAAFGSGVAGFCKAVNDATFNKSKVDAAVDAGTRLAALGKDVDPVGGLIDIFTGTNDLGTFGATLSAFGSGVAGFAKSVNDATFTKSKVDAAVDAGTRLAALGKDVDPVGGLIDIFAGTNDLGTFGVTLGTFGAGVAAFADSVNDATFNKEKVDLAVSVGTSLAELGKSVDPVGGLIDIFAGTNDLGTFGTTLGVFGEGIAAFANSVNDATFNKENVDLAVSVGTSLSALGKDVDPVGGLIEIFTGTSSLGAFGTTLGAFGEGIAAFAKSVNDAEFDKDNIGIAVDAGTKLAALGKDVDAVGGMIEIFTGTNGLGAFGNSLPAFGEGIAGFAKAVSEGTYDIDSISIAIVAAERLAAMSGDVAGVDGMIDLWKGRSDLGTFGSSLEEFGQGLADFSAAVSGKIDKDSVDIASATGLTLSEMAKNIGEAGIPDLTTFNTGIYNLGTTLVQLGQDTAETNWDNIDKLTTKATGLQDISQKLSSIDTGKMNAAITSFKDLVTLINSMTGADSSGLSTFVANFGDIATEGITSFVNGIQNGQDSTVEAVNGMLNKITDALKGKLDSLKSLGSDMSSNIVSGFSNYDSYSISTTCNLVGSAIAEGIRNQYAKVYNAGGYLTSGIANGIRDNQMAAINAAEGVMTKAINAANAKAKIESPSKVMEESGMYFDKGLAIGLTRFANLASDASGEVAEDTLAAMSNPLSKVADLLGSDLDLCPVITPVLDTSMIEAGMAGLSNMFGAEQAIRVAIQGAEVDSSIEMKNDIKELIRLNNAILSAINSGRDIYLNEDLIIGRIDRRLGMA